ncbi:cytochrome P450 [Antrihabitans stalactiti]|uniref:Cytochrome P450 n=1 Tax=Antrihabitans stalactiti TaxID=2584121 RepID=A0A848KHS4_9NOCA|nr:cytochrome P450 [Antrihabitans stalactiti]NMN98583.1 cytochrome P450 [Antrihabitans stalactiti]
MSLRIWARWAALHAGPRTFMKVAALRGAPFPRIMNGDADRNALVEQVRAQGRLIHTPFVGVTADHELTRTILRDNRFGVVSPAAMDLPKAMKWVIAKTELDVVSPVEPPSMLMTNQPDHTRYRKAVARTFTPRAVAKLEDTIAHTTEALLDTLANTRNVELIADFAARLPVAVIAEMLGVPEEMRPNLLGWGNAGAPLLDVGLPWHVYRDAIETMREVNESIDERVVGGADDGDDTILADLTLNSGFDRRELIANAGILVGAGFETTVNLIGNGAVLLRNHPNQLQLLRERPELWPNAIEEILRYDSPVSMTARVALEDVEVCGQRFPKGANTVLLLSGANRDPAVFADPARFDVTRSNAKEHLSFSTGIHACLGAHLARTEGIVGLRSLFDRFPDLQIEGTPHRRELTVLQGFESLPTSLGRARDRATERESA